MACTGIQVQPGCCCSVAYEGTFAFMAIPPGTPSACLTSRYLTEALTPSNIDNLSQYRLLFVGPPRSAGGAQCGLDYYQFTESQNTKIKQWVEAGGRLVASTEYLACFDGTYPATTPNLDRFNTFMGILGSGMQMTTAIPDGCNPSCDTFQGVPRPVPIMSGLSGIWHAGNGQITGGTQICRQNNEGGGCNGEISFINAERIGDGIVFAVADSNVLAFCETPNRNCEFFRRVCNWPVESML